MLEEFGPELVCIKGSHNAVADALSRMKLSEEEFALDVSSFSPEDFPENCPLSHAQTGCEQAKDAEFQQKRLNDPELFENREFVHADKRVTLVCDKETHKIAVPPKLQKLAVRWCHIFLSHPGKTRMEKTVGQHCTWPKMRDAIQRVVRRCPTCLENKKVQQKYGLLPYKEADVTPWHTLCIDLIGPCDFGDPKKDTNVQLWCMTMIDPATGLQDGSR